MSKQFRENALAWGVDGENWLASIPSLITLYEKKWNIEVLPPFSLSYNYVAPAQRADGTRVVLKIGFPKDPEVQSEIRALTHFNGNGCVEILESDSENSVFLLNAVEPGIPLSALEDDDQATKIIAQTMKRLHQPLPKDHDFISVGAWATALDRYKQRFTTRGPLPDKLIDQAKELFHYLIESSAAEVLVHGDLHHDNILTSAKHGWVAIDPKGIAAEPAYEVAAMIRNPYEKLKSVVDLKPILIRRIKILSQELNMQPERIQKWCIAQTVLSAIWNIESAKGAEHALRIAQTLVSLAVN